MRWSPLLISLAVAACGNGSSGTPPAMVDAGTRTTGFDGGADAGIPCSEIATRFCDWGGPCVSSWADVLDAGCPHIPLVGGYEVGACEGFELLSVHGADSSAEAYFDAASGALVAVLSFHVGGELASCEPGRVAFADPGCAGHAPLPACSGADR